MQGRFYQVICSDCGYLFECLTAFADFSKISCPQCGSFILQVREISQPEKEVTKE